MNELKEKIELLESEVVELRAEVQQLSKRPDLVAFTGLGEAIVNGFITGLTVSYDIASKDLL